MRKITSFLLSMILALVAIPIQAAIQADVIIDQEFSSLAELEGKAFAIVNKETGKALFGTNNQNLGYDVLTTAFSASNSGYYFKLETPAEDATIASCYLLRLQTPEGAGYNFDSKPGYLNSQPVTGWCSFILGLNNQNGQDIKNGAVWDIQYVEGEGFALLNKGTGLYLNDNTPAKYAEPVYWTFCTLKKDLMTAFKPLFDEEAVIKACGTSEEANAAYDAIVGPIKANVEAGNITDPEADLATIDAALNVLAKAQTTAGANFTRLIANPEINGADGWTIERPVGGNGPLLGGTAFEYWAGNARDRAQASFDYYQIISGLPNGAYKVTADLYNSLNGEKDATWNATSGVYGKGVNESVTLVDADGTTLKPYTTDQVFVVDGSIRIGVKNTVTPMAARWFVADNFQLTYLGRTPEYPAIAKQTLAADIAAAQAIVEAKAGVGEGIFLIPEDAFSTFSAAVEAAKAINDKEEATVEEVEAAVKALAAATKAYKETPANAPAADKQYTLSLKTTDEASPFDLSIAEAGITIAEVGTPVSFVAQADGTYALSNGTVYVVYKGGDTWSLVASTDAYGWTIAAVEGGYTITGKNGFLGTNTKDGAAAGSSCYGNKKSSDGFYIWAISEYVAPTPTYSIAIAEGIENGTIVAGVTTAKAGATVTLTATPAEGYKLEAITVTAGEASVEVTEAEGAYTFVMPAANVTVSATFAAEAVEPEPVIVYTDLSVDDYYTWTSFDATAEKVNKCPTTLVLNESTDLPFGDGNVGWLNYVDLSDAVNMVITATEGTPRVLFNRIVDKGEMNVELPKNENDDNYWTVVDNGDGSKTYTIDIALITKKFGFAHLLCIKGNWAKTTLTSVKIGREEKAPVEPTTYAIAIAEGIENGTIEADVETAKEGATVTLTATPAEGYKLEAITVTAGEASVEVKEAEGAYTFVMPAANVTVSATFVAEAVEPTPDPNLIEIAQTVDADAYLACEKIEGEEYTQYNFAGDISVAFKMLNVDVKDCDYVVIKFAEPTPADLKASFVEGQGFETIQEGVTEWKNIIAENTTVKDGIIPQITLLTIFTGEGKSVKVEGVYKHKIASGPTEPELAKVENMNLTVAKDAVIDDKDKTFPVVFGYKAIVDESIAPVASMSVTYKVTTNGEEILSETFEGIDIAKETQNISIKNMEYGKTYTVTITSVSVSYFDFVGEDIVNTVVFEQKFEAGEHTATFTTNAVPVSIDGINAAAKANRKVVENGRVVIYKNGVKTMSSGVSIR